MEKSEKVFQKRSTVFSVVLLIIFLGTVQVDSVSLDSDGYYDIVIAINEKTAQNEIEGYIDNLKVSIQDLSSAIWESTHRKFSIRSADIVLPNHWNTQADGFVSTQTYQNADIRISHEYSVPQAINPTFCGYPGRTIELPYSFFNERDTGPYGPTGKALLTMWARYRWGIFEENGYPGDPLFSYYWKAWAPWSLEEKETNADVDEPWKVTSCSDTEVKGKYETITGEKCGPDYEPPEDSSTTVEPEDPNNEYYPPPSNCRFNPEIYNQTASTSLMSFTFIQSLIEFCDDTTHDKGATNRQNYFCQYKSAWEVIRESADWKQLEEDSETVRAPIKYRILKKTEKPLLFILSDGVNKPPDEVLSTMTSKLQEMFDKSEHWNVLTSAGVFPSLESTDSFDTVYNWDQPWYNKQQLTTAFQGSFGSRDNTTFRNFGAAIQDVGTLLKDKNHLPGGVIIVLKYGSETDSEMRKQWPAYEADVIATIIQQNIRLFVLEGEDDQAEPSDSFRLKNIAELSGGQHFQIGSSPESQEENIKNVNTAMTEVDKILTSGHVPKSKYRLAFKDARAGLQGEESVEIPFLVNHRDVTGLYVYLYTASPGMSNLIIKQVALSPVAKLDFEEYNMWNGAIVEKSFKSYFAQWTNTSEEEPLTEPTEWSFFAKCDSYNYYACKYVLVVIVELANENSQENELNDENINIELYTSADDDGNIVDLAVQNVASLKGVAFTVYAKLEKNGHPINSPYMEVMAHICHFRHGKMVQDGPWDFVPPVECRDVILKDDGPLVGDPDLTANDGIFSGNCIPGMAYPYEHETRGIYHIFVTAKLLTTRTIGDQRSSPLPIDQKSHTCGSGYQGCWTETVTQPFFVHANLKRRIDIIGLDEDTYGTHRAATRVLDLRMSQNGNGYDLEWTNPTVLTDVPGKADRIEIYFANSFDAAVKESYMATIEIPNPGIPGQSAKLPVTDLQEGEKRWYWMKGFISDPNNPTAARSNIMFAQATPAFFGTTTTTTTTTTPAPTESTTRLTTLETPPSTIPTTARTTEPSTATSRATRTTTRNPITVTTTTARPTTVPFEVTTEKIKQWYQTTEAIVTFSVFGAGMLLVIVVVGTYMKMMNRD